VKENKKFIFFKNGGLNLAPDSNAYQSMTNREKHRGVENTLQAYISGIKIEHGYIVPMLDIYRLPREALLLEYELIIISGHSTVLCGNILIEGNDDGKVYGNTSRYNYVSFPVGGLLQAEHVSSPEYRPDAMVSTTVGVMFRIKSVRRAWDPLQENNIPKQISIPPTESCGDMLRCLGHFFYPRCSPLPLYAISESNMDLSVCGHHNRRYVERCEKRYVGGLRDDERFSVFESPLERHHQPPSGTSSDPDPDNGSDACKVAIVFGVVVSKDNTYSQSVVRKYVCVLCGEHFNTMLEMERQCRLYNLSPNHPSLPQPSHTVKMLIQSYGLAVDVDTNKRLIDLFYIPDISPRVKVSSVATIIKFIRMICNVNRILCFVYLYLYRFQNFISHTHARSCDMRK
jgi:hypothetical protein